MNQTVYNLLLTLHIIFAVVAFAPSIALPMFSRHARGKVDSDNKAVVAVLGVKMVDQFIVPGLIATLVFGIALVVSSDGVFDFSQAWISASFTVLLLLLLVAWFLLRPALRSQALATNENVAASAGKKAGMALGLFHLGLVIMVALMVWKPGV